MLRRKIEHPVLVTLETCLRELEANAPGCVLKPGTRLGKAVVYADAGDVMASDTVAGALLETLSRIHECGWIHGDVGPQNVILDPDTGHVRLRHLEATIPCDPSALTFALIDMPAGLPHRGACSLLGFAHPLLDIEAALLTTHEPRLPWWGACRPYEALMLTPTSTSPLLRAVWALLLSPPARRPESVETLYFRLTALAHAKDNGALVSTWADLVDALQWGTCDFKVATLDAPLRVLRETINTGIGRAAWGLPRKDLQLVLNAFSLSHKSPAVQAGAILPHLVSARAQGLKAWAICRGAVVLDETEPETTEPIHTEEQRKDETPNMNMIRARPPSPPQLDVFDRVTGLGYRQEHPSEFSSTESDPPRPLPPKIIAVPLPPSTIRQSMSASTDLCLLVPAIIREPLDASLATLEKRLEETLCTLTGEPYGEGPCIARDRELAEYGVLTTIKASPFRLLHAAAATRVLIFSELTLDTAVIHSPPARLWAFRMCVEVGAVIVAMNSRE